MISSRRRARSTRPTRGLRCDRADPISNGPEGGGPGDRRRHAEALAAKEGENSWAFTSDRTTIVNESIDYVEAVVDRDRSTPLPRSKQ
jgi:hypothetical protein